MDESFLEAIREIQEEKNLDEEVVVEALKKALTKAYRNEHNIPGEYEMQVEIDLGDFNLEVFTEKEIVRQPFNESCQIEREAAEEFTDEPDFGERIMVSLEDDNLSRSNLRMVKNIFEDNIERGEQRQHYEGFKEKKLNLVNGVVQRFQEKTVYVRLDDNVEAILPFREQVEADDYRMGNRMKFLVVKVSLNSQGLLVVLSRTHPLLIERLFELHIPEVHDELVEVIDVAREAGARSKVAVKTNDPTIDAIGTCVGPQGSRIQSIVQEVNGEKIDIIPYEKDIQKLIINSLSPADVTRVNLLEDEETAQVVVPEDQLSLAIGKGGQNARLTAKLSGWSIDIYSEQEFASLQSEEALEVAASIFKDSAASEEEDFLTEINGVGEGLAGKLKDNGFSIPTEIIDSGPEALREVSGIGEKKAEKIYEQVREYVQKVATSESVEEVPEEEKAENIKESIFSDSKTEAEEVEADSEIRSPFKETE